LVVIKEFDALLTCQGHDTDWSPKSEQFLLGNSRSLRRWPSTSSMTLWISGKCSQNRVGSTAIAVGISRSRSAIAGKPLLTGDYLW